MSNTRQPRDELQSELQALRVRVAQLERADAERERAEKALRQSEERYRRIVETANEGIWVLDAEGKTAFANPRMAEMLGCTVDEMTGTSLFDFMDEEWKATARARVKRRQAGITEQHDFKFRRADGGEFWAIVNTNPILDEQGNYLGALGMITDITDRKGAEEALQRANRALLTRGRCSRVVAHAADEPELLENVCRAVVEAGGYRLAWVGFAEQDEARSVRPVAQAGFDAGYLATVNITWADSERGRGPTGTAIRTGRPQVARHILTDPAFAPWRSEAVKRGYKSSLALPLRVNGQALGALNVFSAEPDAFDEAETELLTDLADDLAHGIAALRTRAEHKRAEQALRDHTNRLEMALDGTGDGIWEWKPSTGEILFDEHWQRVLGYTLGERTFDFDWWRESVHPDSFPVFEKVLEDYLNGRTEYFEFEYLIRRKTGEWHWIWARGQCVEYDKDNKPLRFIGTHRDITDRKRAEQELRGQKEILQTILDNAPIMVAFLDAQAGHKWVNRGWERTLGWTLNEAQSRDILAELYPDPEYCRYVRDFIADASKIWGDFKTRVRDGRVLDTTWANVPLSDGSNIGIGLDITERKRAEDALRKSEDRYRRLYEEAPNAYFTVGSDGYIRQCNSRAGALLGCPSEALVGRHVLELYADGPSAKEKASRVFKQVRAGERVADEELQLQRTDGTPIWISLTVRPVRDSEGRMVETRSMVIDITERKQADERSARQTAVLRAIKEVFHRALTCENEEQLGKTSLAVAEELTGSKFGYLGEVNQAGLIDTIAISNPGWDACAMPVSDARRRTVGMPIRGIYGSTIREGKSLIVNGREMAIHPDRVGTPEGHPEITAFLGVPLKHAGKTIGMIGLGNKPGGYELADQEAVEGLSVAIVQGLRYKRAETELRAGEERYRTLVDNIDLGISLIDSDYQIVMTNASHVKKFGKPLSEFPGKHCYAEFEKRDEVCPHCPGTRAMATGKVTEAETEGVRDDDSRFSVRIQTFPVFGADGAATGFIEVAEDITDRKRAEQAVRESEERFRGALENIPAVIVIYDRDLRIRYINTATRQITGRPVSDFIGRREEEIWPPEVYEVYLPTLREALETRTTRSLETDLALPNTGVHTLSITCVPLMDEEGAVREILGITHDLTERKRAEDERRKLEEQLRQSQKMEAIGQLAGGVAHDFNNLLTAILGNTEMLLRTAQDDLGALATEWARTGLEQVKTAGDRAAALTRQLLAFGRKQVTMPTVLEPQRIVNDAEKLLRRLLREDIAFDLKVAPGTGCIRVDAGQIQQVIMNLVLNARDAMPRGGDLSVTWANAEVDQAHAAGHVGVRPGPHVMLTVRDTGVGMTEETMEHMFEPFFTTKPRGQGTGLGLATVYAIVKEAGGHILVESEPSKGTVFKVYFPKADEQIVGADDAAAEGMLHGGETILVCEDDDLVRAVTCQILEAAGYVVLGAENGNHAIEVAERHEGAIDLLVSDLVMPETNGLELAEAMSANRPRMATLFVSGYATDVIKVEDARKEGYEFLPKPFSPTGLLQRVREVLDAKKAKTHEA